MPHPVACMPACMPHPVACQPAFLCTQAPPTPCLQSPGRALAPVFPSFRLRYNTCRPRAATCSATRSSLHYDPYHNLLCVVRGCKTVWLVAPAATPWLSPQPLTHESANHSPADLARPDLRRFPGLARALPLLRRFEVAAGDALFIPEGWWHQVSCIRGRRTRRWVGKCGARRGCLIEQSPTTGAMT